MGPMSGIGDAIFWGVLRVIAASVGMSLCSGNGTILGPIVFLLIYNIPSIACRWYLTVLGYRTGTSFITKLYEGGMRESGILGSNLLTIALLVAGGVALVGWGILGIL